MLEMVIGLDLDFHGLIDLLQLVNLGLEFVNVKFCCMVTLFAGGEI